MSKGHYYLCDGCATRAQPDELRGWRELKATVYTMDERIVEYVRDVCPTCSAKKTLGELLGET